MKAIISSALHDKYANIRELNDHIFIQAFLVILTQVLASLMVSSIEALSVRKEISASMCSSQHVRA